MNILKINNDYSWLISDDEKLKNTLWKSLRFRDRKAFHTPLYKQGRWDGYTEYFKRNTGRFLTGLLPEIELALKRRKSEYQIQDNRDQVEFICDEIDNSFLSDLTNPEGEPLDLHDYQVDFINTSIKHHRGVIFAPTSAGKTNIMLGILRAVKPGTPILFLANRKSLVQQNHKEIIAAGFPKVGRLYDKFYDPQRITCATVQSLHKIDSHLDRFKVLVVDEIHDMMSKVPKKMYGKLKGASVRMAVSATPFKDGGKDKVQMYAVKGYFGPVFTTDAGDEKGILKTKQLQEREILSASRCTFYPIEKPSIPYDIYQDAVTNGIAENQYFHDIVVKLVKKLKGRTLILVDRIVHGDILNEMIPGSHWVRGQDTLETREQVIEYLKHDQSDVVGIATQQIFNTGLNVYLHNLVNAAGGKAEHLIIQRMGRGLRTAKDKEMLNYYDFIFNINDYLARHSRKRIRILRDEGHEVIIKKEIDL
jgi:superfamily II DNA or RNA helicase